MATKRVETNPANVKPPKLDYGTGPRPSNAPAAGQEGIPPPLNFNDGTGPRPSNYQKPHASRRETNILPTPPIGEGAK